MSDSTEERRFGEHIQQQTRQNRKQQRKRRQTVSLTENGYGATAYLSRDLLEDTGCPLDRGGKAIAQLVPNVGILLVDVDDPADYEVIQDGRD